MFIPSEGAILLPTCVDDQDAYRRRWDRAPYVGVHSPSLLKLLGLAARKTEKCGLLARKLNVLYVYHKL